MLPILEAPELVIGICSPLGTPNGKVTTLISDALKRYNYETINFKVTELMKQISLPSKTLVDTPLEQRYNSYIEYANSLRDVTGVAGILSYICCSALRSHRRIKKSAPDSYVPRTSYVFDQFKRKEEIEVLRQIYGRLFIMISVYSDEDNRIIALSERIAETHSESRPTEDHKIQARKLVSRDAHEEDVPAGQRMRDAFPLADLFINIDDFEGSKKAIERFIDAFFGSNSVSPTRPEYGMYLAKSAALRSLDLSRQVGAAIFSSSGEVISLGCNEVPRSNGGTYWSGDSDDSRDFQLGQDENERIKRSLMADAVRRLHQSKLLATNRSEDELVSEVVEQLNKKGSRLRDAQLMDLIEFGRIIHAEMSAITDAARTGRSTRDSVLYCTTFPCHICAKHIVASGVSRVYYIEPYPKRYAKDLHRDSITLKEGDGSEKTIFAPFIGISPYRFRELFEKGRRKNDTGQYSPWNESSPKPQVKLTIATYLQNDQAIVKILEDLLATKQANNELMVLNHEVGNS